MTVLDVLGRPVRRQRRVLFHEHLQFGWPGFHLDHCVSAAAVEEDVDRAARALEALADLGYGVFVDVTTIECGRDLGFLQQVAVRTRVQVVAAVGLYTQTQGYPLHFATLSTDELVDLYLHDLDPDQNPTPAGVVKVATRQPPFSQREVRALEAAGAVAAQRDVPVISHAESLACAWAQLEILLRAGAPARRVVLGHLDDEWANPDGVAELACTGVFVGIDRFGHVERLPDDRRIDLLLALRDKGVLSQVLISHDAAFRFLGRRPVRPIGENPYLHIPTVVVPDLLRRGLTKTDLDQVLVANPGRLLGC